MSEADGMAEYGLVMPFVVTKSHGGPLDDHSFVAGARFGQDAAELKSDRGVEEWSRYVYPEMVPQYDLLAMNEGYTMTAEPWAEHPDEWVLVTFTKEDGDAN